MKNNSMVRKAGIVASLAVLLALAACGSQVDQMGPAPVAQGMDRGREAAQDASPPVALESNDTATMGAGPAPAAAAEDPDAKIATAVKSSLMADPDFTALKIDVHSDDGVVTLIGRAPDPASRERATQIARNVREVRSVENQLTLG